MPANPARLGPSPIAKHSVCLHGRETSIALEPEFWSALRSIARQDGVRLYALVERIDDRRNHHNLNSALRVAILRHFQQIGAPR